MTDDASATPTEPADEEPTAHADKEPTAPADKEPTAPADKKPTAAERIRGAAKTGIKLGVAVAILAWLFSRGDLDPDTIKRPLETPGTVLLVLCLGTIGLTMSGVRWWLLLGAVGIRIPVLAAVRLCWIGHFWNMVIPGAV